ncbi:enoyl-CoA hydratase/isomerase family protein [Candidimonas humi]|uniref:Enoyl-CoA hydratase/isomerase family protein n=1 Tax=Candidimonas humi TaxID=683355 RepID=A0ABV8NVI9_9BURK|nr:enoyl-CoA hydratase/isomerase family protein [Candidimonas humi]MBV6304516.1 enoyl-CoA hydratase/isomerase family protein [Candidimonas humi]
MNEPNQSPTLQMDGPIATITLTQPEVANRLDGQAISRLIEHIDRINSSEALVLRIFSTGKYFCSGYNIEEIKGGQESGFDTLTNALEDCRPVTIAAIQGGVYGGATDLALACDFRVGTPASNMFMPAARLGLHFYQRGMERYISRLGLNTAKKLFLTASKLDAHEMLSCGFLTDLVDPDQLQQEVDKLSLSICGMAPIAVLGMKKHLNRIARNMVDADELRSDVTRSRSSADIQEGRSAWKEKRAPKFTGK